MNDHGGRHVWEQKHSFQVCFHVHNSDNPPAQIFGPQSINSGFAAAIGYLVIAVRTKRGNRAATIAGTVDCVDAPPETSSKCKLERSIKRRESAYKRRERRMQQCGQTDGNIERRVDRKTLDDDKNRALRYGRWSDGDKDDVWRNVTGHSSRIIPLPRQGEQQDFPTFRHAIQHHKRAAIDSTSRSVQGGTPNVLTALQCSSVTSNLAQKTDQ
jgi:hypothetical protein